MQLTYPEIQDTIIGLMEERKNYGSAELAKRLNIPEVQLIACIGMIEAQFPKAFIKYQGTGDDRQSFALHPGMAAVLKVFVQNGGFVSLVKEREAEKERLDYKNNLEITQLELAVRAAQGAELNAERSEKEAKSSRYAAWVSALAALAVIIWEVFKSMHVI